MNSVPILGDTHEEDAGIICHSAVPLSKYYGKFVIEAKEGMAKTRSLVSNYVNYGWLEPVQEVQA